MARRLLLLVFIITIGLAPLPSSAQRGAEIFGFILDQAGRELQRQEHLERERQQRQYLQRLHQQFVANWQACHRNQIEACDQALSYPYLNFNDRTRLIAKRDQIVAAQQEAATRVESARIEAELEHQRRQQEQAEQAERELARQREEAERIRLEREREERRLADLRAFANQRDACRRYDRDACDSALSSVHVSDQDRTELRRWRGVAEQFRNDGDACKSGFLSACDAALASPALKEADRPALNEWRSAALPVNRALATVARTLDTVRTLPTSTLVTGSLALVLAFALGAIGYRRRSAVTESPPGEKTSDAIPQDAAAASESSSASQVPTTNWRQRFTDILSRLAARLTVPLQPTSAVNADPAPPPSETRDTPGAIAALELAHAYIIEVREAERPSLDDRELRKHHLNTLALAAKQLDLAERLDPDAVLEITEDDAPLRFSIAELKAQALLLEGMTHQTYDTKRAVPALRRATVLDPDNPSAHYLLGLLHTANMNRSEAVAALQRAVDLDPKNLTYRKELNRAQSLSVGEIAAYRATRAGEHIYDTGIATANAGIRIYNVGVICWNIFAVTWNIVTFPLRLALKIAGHR